MAETLGSLIDKLTIKDLREFHIRGLLRTGETKRFSRKDLNNKLKILKSQKSLLAREIEDFLAGAMKGKAIVTDPKLKLYNESGIAKIGKFKRISAGIDKLTKKNIELWNLEDEARRKDVTDAYIGRIKRKIDKANQERNDLIDTIDHIFKTNLKKSKI